MTSSHLNLNSRRNSITLGSAKDEAQTPQGNASTADVSGGEREPLTNGFDSPAVKPRLVGLSQPFFATSPPLDTPKQQLAAIEQVAAAATRRGDKVRVLVAEDNIGKHGPVVQTGCLTLCHSQPGGRLKNAEARGYLRSVPCTICSKS